jgi:hypothetical protein
MGQAYQVRGSTHLPHIPAGGTYPIAGTVHAAISASSAIERVKMLFDVLESTWRFMAKATLAAVVSRPQASPEALEPRLESLRIPAGLRSLVDR